MNNNIYGFIDYRFDNMMSVKYEGNQFNLYRENELLASNIKFQYASKYVEPYTQVYYNMKAYFNDKSTEQVSTTSKQ